jgi:hypothetical protein
MQYRIAFRSDVENTYPYFLETLFSEKLLQRANEEMLFRSAFEIEQLGFFSPLRKAIRYLTCPKSSLCFKRGR